MNKKEKEKRISELEDELFVLKYGDKVEKIDNISWITEDQVKQFMDFGMYGIDDCIEILFEDSYKKRSEEEGYIVPLHIKAEFKIGDN